MFILYITTPASCVHTLLCNMTVQFCQWTNTKIGLADRWQQSFPSTTVHPAAVNLCARVHKHRTRATQLSDSSWYHQWLTESQAGKSWLSASSHHGSRGNIQAIILIVDWLSYSETFFIYEENEVNSQRRNWRNNFFRTNQARCNLPPWVPGLATQAAWSNNTWMCTATECNFLWQYFSHILSKSV